MAIANANKGNAVVGVERNPGIAAAIGGDRHVGDVMEALGADVDLVVIALAKIVDVIVSVSVTGREDEAISAGQSSHCPIRREAKI
jgi:hypothetical protein